MKNLLLTFILLFSFSINAQYAVMSAVDLNDGAEEDYLKLEKFGLVFIKKLLTKDYKQVGLYGRERLKKGMNQEIMSI